jgi:hypothetical protein
MGDCQDAEKFLHKSFSDKLVKGDSKFNMNMDFSSPPANFM